MVIGVGTAALLVQVRQGGRGVHRVHLHLGLNQPAVNTASRRHGMHLMIEFDWNMHACS
jgi:hypothetical protein